MTLLGSCLIDILRPEENVFPYYNSFLSRYSLITVTALVSQCSLMPETYEGMTKSVMDSEIDSMIAGLPEAAQKKRNMYPILCLGAGIDPGKLVQETEERTFVSELFTEEAQRYSLSNREMVLKGLNLSSFLNYFFLIDDCLKDIYIDLCSPPETFIGNSKIINVCLEGIISKMDVQDLFFGELYRRSKFFFDFESLDYLWSLMNLIRNQIAHANGFYDEKAKNKFKAKLELLAGHFCGNDELLLSINMILDVFEKHQTQIEETGYLIVDDSLENIIRNMSIFIMESLYICKRDEIANKLGSVQ